jgi:hypothetical protein
LIVGSTGSGIFIAVKTGSWRAASFRRLHMLEEDRGLAGFRQSLALLLQLLDATEGELQSGLGAGEQHFGML